MKTKFETNVASQLPKTKTHEPGLPWKVTNEDLEHVVAKEDDYKAAVTGTPPLKTRAIFLVLLIVAVFAATLYFVSLIAIENEKARENLQRKETAVVSLQASLEKVKNEKDMLNGNLAQLEKRVNELNAQKEIFTTVIESLTKRGEEFVLEKDKTEKTVIPKEQEGQKGP
jgi:septal ring factor EnvC (AmiA/AmiB activator)